MADNSIVAGLFGVDPAAYAQQQLVAQTDYNKAMATMDPLAAGKFAMMQGASQLGNVGQGLLGIQDPMMQQATELKTVARGFDLTTPQGLIEYAKAIQSKYPQYAQMAIAQANKLQESAATVYSRTREHLSTMGKLQSERDRLLAINPNDPRIAEYNRAIAAEGSSKTPQISMDVKMLDAALGRRTNFLKENDAIVKQGTAIQQALTSLNAGSPFGQAAFDKTVVSALGGDKQTSKAEMQMLVNTGSLPERFGNWASRLGTGQNMDLTADDQKQVLTAIEGNLKRRWDSSRNAALKASSNVKDLQGQENYMAPTYQEVVGGGHLQGKRAFNIGDTINSTKYGDGTQILATDPVTGEPTKIYSTKQKQILELKAQ